MTPIGHLTSSAVVAGSAGLLKPRELKWATLWYVVFLVVFSILRATITWGDWGMQVYDTFSDLPFYILLIVWFRSERRKQLTLGIFIGGLILACYSHLFDKAFLLVSDTLPDGMFRPHNMIHSPFFAIALSALATPLIGKLMKLPDRLPLFVALVTGYLLHITMDTITYDYPIYWLWPFSDYHATFITAFQQPDVTSHWLGNPYFIADMPLKSNPQGYILYWSELLLNCLLLGFYWLVIGLRSLAGRAQPPPPSPAQSQTPLAPAEPA
ncbi:MAG: metal-dependent hydrolase [Acidobacteriota bacterium]